MEKLNPLANYMQIEAVATRKVIRQVAAGQGRVTYWIHHSIMRIRPGFNARRIYEGIPDLAVYITHNGMPPDPMVVDLLPDGTIAYIDIGHRRFEALNFLSKSGELPNLIGPGINCGYIECFVNDDEVDELTRLRRQCSSNSGWPLTDIEMGELCIRIRDGHSQTMTDIAKLLGKSRQYVKNMITIAEQPEEIKNAIISKNISPTAAIELANKLKDDEKRTEMVMNAVSSGKVIQGTDVKRLEGEDAEGNVKGKADKNTGETFDESRPELKQCNNVIGLVDKINSLVGKSGNQVLINQVDEIVKWIQKDMAEVRAHCKTKTKR